MAAVKPDELHKTIDKAADAAQPIVDRVVSSAHAGVDKLSGLLSGASTQFSDRSAQVTDTYQQLADSGREYVRNKPGTPWQSPSAPVTSWPSCWVAVTVATTNQ